MILEAAVFYLILAALYSINVIGAQRQKVEDLRESIAKLDTRLKELTS